MPDSKSNIQAPATNSITDSSSSLSRDMTSQEMSDLSRQIKQWALELGFSQLGITDTDLTAEEPKLQQWLDMIITVK